MSMLKMGGGGGGGGSVVYLGGQQIRFLPFGHKKDLVESACTCIHVLYIVWYV